MLDRTPQLSDLDIAPAPPIGDYLIGRSVTDAVAIVPRIFNLCRMTQEVAVKLAFDVELPQDWQAQLQADILREHQFRLGILLPGRLGLQSLAMPRGEEAATDWLASFVGTSGFPDTAEAFERFLTGLSPASLLLQAVNRCFAPGEACYHDLVPTSIETAETHAPQDNTVAARAAHHRVMQHIAATRGHGPLWQIVGRILDVENTENELLPAPVCSHRSVFVPAARGLFVVRASQSAGQVTGFTRVTPTDHLLAQGGVLEQALANLPDHKAHRASLVIDIFDPCQPVAIKEGASHA